jgi:hypothetical protein
MRVARGCGLLVGAKDPSKFHLRAIESWQNIPRLGVGKKGAKMSKLEGVALQLQNSVHSQSIDAGACASLFVACIVFPATRLVVNRPTSVQR